jgi:ketosteroid isomerase-like protein
MPGKSDIGMQTLSVLVSDDGSLVSESGTYTMKDSTGIQKASGRFATVFRKNGNKYECVREMVMSDKKEEAKAPAPDKK